MKCETCGEYHWSEHHQCAPEWQILELPDPDDWEDSSRARGVDAAAAVETWADRRDASGDYDIVSGTPATVRVRQLGEDGEGEVMIVHGESVPSYNARPVMRLGCSRCGVRQDFTVELLDSSCTGTVRDHRPRALAEDRLPCTGRLEAYT